MSYDIGDLARLSITFRNAITNSPANPTTVSLLIQSPDNIQSAVSPIVNDEVGVYHYDLSLTQSGTYAYRWTGTGSVVAVEEGTLVVSPTQLVPQPPAPPAAGWTYADLYAIDRSLQSGVSRVSFQDRDVTYRSLDDLIKLRYLIATFLAGTNGVNRQVRMYTSKGV